MSQGSCILRKKIHKLTLKNRIAEIKMKVRFTKFKRHYKLNRIKIKKSVIVGKK